MASQPQVPFVLLLTERHYAPSMQRYGNGRSSVLVLAPEVQWNTSQDLWHIRTRQWRGKEKIRLRPQACLHWCGTRPVHALVGGGRRSSRAGPDEGGRRCRRLNAGRHHSPAAQGKYACGVILSSNVGSAAEIPLIYVCDHVCARIPRRFDGVL